MPGALRRALPVLVALAVLSACSPGLPWTDPPPAPSGTASGFPCPAWQRSPSATPTTALVRDGRVVVGRLSYPLAPAPFGPPLDGDYLPFSVERAAQHADVEQQTEQSMGWESFVGLARLSTGDGAWGGQQGAEAVGQCSLSMTWRGIDYRPRLRSDTATSVDGHPAWQRVTDLSFTVPNVRTTSEVQTVIVVTVDAETYAYLSYLPGSVPQLGPVLEATRTGLRVS